MLIQVLVAPQVTEQDLRQSGDRREGSLLRNRCLDAFGIPEILTQVDFWQHVREIEGS
jgi:hypothetical protein